MKYKFIYKTAVFLLFFGFLVIFSSTYMLTNTLVLGLWEWLIYGSSLIMLVSSIIIVIFRQKNSEILELDVREQKITADEEQLQRLQKELQTKHVLLTQKENDVKQQFIKYQQYIEFPQDTECTDDNNEYFDNEVAQLLQDRAEIIFDKIINQKYTENKTFKNELLLEDVIDLIDSVARIHHPDSQHPLLETSIENLLRSVNRLSLQLLVLVDSFPVNIKEYNLRKTYLYIQKSATTIGYYKKAEPFLTYVSPALRIGLAAANPVIGMAQIAAIEAGKHVIKKGSERYALNLLHDVIEIIGEQASSIFGEGSLRYRSKHWIYAVELAEIIHYFNPVKSEDLSKAMKIINGLILRSEYDRLFIHHCLTQGKSANPERYESDFISDKDKQEIVAKLSHFIENHVNKNRNDESDKKVKVWRKKVESRLGVSIQINIDENDAEYLKNMLSSGSPEKKIKSFLARYILTLMTESETPQFIYTDIYLDSSIQSSESKELWLIGSNKQLMLITVGTEDKVELIWHYDPTQNHALLFHRINRVVADDCRISGGEWQAGFYTDKEPEFVVKGRNITSYSTYFQILDNFKRLIF